MELAAERRRRDQEQIRAARAAAALRLEKTMRWTAVSAPRQRDPSVGAWLFGIAASILCWIAGVQLLDIKAAQPDSILEAIAHGMGLYFFAKGFVVGPTVVYLSRIGRADRYVRGDLVQQLCDDEDRLRTV